MPQKCKPTAVRASRPKPVVNMFGGTPDWGNNDVRTMAAAVGTATPINKIGEDYLFERITERVSALPEEFSVSNFSRVLDPDKRDGAVEAFENALRLKVIGQGGGVAALVTAYQKFLAHMNAPGRPIANLLYLGPTGTGKTRTVEAMGEYLFGDARSVIRIDCAEFQHSHEIAKLIGSPPGYLGHRETSPLLTQEAINQHHTEKLKLTVLLFDEIEKASDALWKLLLGILDKASLTLGDNRRVDLSQCIIVMTSNLGAAEMSGILDGGIGFAASRPVINNKLATQLSDLATGAAKRKFDPEFMNRIDEIVVYNTLGEDELRLILEIELGAVQRRLLSVGAGSSAFAFRASTAFKKFLLEDGYNPKYGARHLKRAIEKHLVTPLSSLIATKQVGYGDLLRVEMLDGKVKFVLEPRNNP